MSYSQQWSLDSIFPNGSQSPQFSKFLAAIRARIIELNQLLEKRASLKESILEWQSLCEQLGQAGSFVACNVAQNVHDTFAEQLQSTLSELGALLSNAANQIDEQLKAMDDAEFQKFLQDSQLQPITYPLSNRRQRAKDKLDLVQETLINEVSVDGYHGWSQMYGTFIGQVQILVRDRKLSWGQAYNLFSNPDRELRKTAFESSNEVWKQNSVYFAPILNHIAGFRLKIYERRDWPVLKEPLDNNRMSKQTLDTMWKVIEKNKAPFIDYLHLKAKLLKLPKLHWYDLEAPLYAQDEKSIPYDEAAQFIVERFSEFSPKMGAFAKRAFEEKWIEAEDRGGKRPGGFCTDVPLQKESRIFMTYSGTKESLFTLAHELGHAFHNEVIFNLPELARHFPMNLAETASTFAEMIVTEAALQREKQPEKRLALLDGKLQRSVAFLCNIHARFIFDVAFHEERKKGTVSADRLCEMMEKAQKTAYCDALQEYHPFFWASKMHFHSTGSPFYNFPYTFGFLFSLGVYLHTREKSQNEESYIALLRDTGSMSAEELAHKHLGVNLGEESFWQKAIDYLKEDMNEFKTLIKI